MKRAKLPRPKPPASSPDDGPEPERMTPRRLAARLQRAAEDLARLRLRLRGEAPYLPGRRLAELLELLGGAESAAVELATDVRVGRVELEPDLVDGAHVPERPLLDSIEAAGIAGRLSEEERARVADRGDTDPGWDAPAPSGDGKPARKAPGFSFDVFQRVGDEHVFLGTIKAPRNEHRALLQARRAFQGQEYRGEDGFPRPIDPAQLVLRPTPRTPKQREATYGSGPSKAERKKSSRSRPVTNGTISGDQWTEEHTARLRDGFAAVDARFGDATEGGAP